MSMQVPPEPIDIQQIQFKLHSKFHLFDVNTANSNYDGINLLAAAGVYGLVFVGNPLSPELQVVRLADIVEKKVPSNVPRRSFTLPSIPRIIVLSCDHSLLTVNYSCNGTEFIDIYSVPSFFKHNVKAIFQRIPVSREAQVKVKQMLWNPVLPNMMAICLDDGTIGMYVLKDGYSSFEYFSIDKSEGAKCLSWSPKGKQLVVAYANGKLAQYKPDLKLAKTIPCTTKLFSNPFAPIAIQWLSTYQFAVVFLEQKEEPTPALFIVNVPKNVPPTYINYDDICYSQAGPRQPQVFLLHILEWNLLLMASANGTEIGILGTEQNTETPTWTQYILLDEARAELPLTADKQDTYPIGISLDIGTTHQLTIGETQIPVMPMVHIYSTHGFLLSFNLINYMPKATGISSPPRPIETEPNLFIEQAVPFKAKTFSAEAFQPQSVAETKSNEQINLTFMIPENSTSTPAKTSISNQRQFESKPTFTNQLFGGPKTTNDNTVEQKQIPASINSKEPPKQALPQPISSANSVVKPIVTVDPSYKSSNIVNSRSGRSEIEKNGLNVESNSDSVLLREMIASEIKSLAEMIRSSLSRSKCLNVSMCSKDECSTLIKNIDKLQETTAQATESSESLSTEIQSLRLSLFESRAMAAEAQSKLELLNKKNISSEENVFILYHVHQRQLKKLENLLSNNQTHFDAVSRQIDAQWSQHLDSIRENNKARMHIPSMENIYQTLEKQHDVLQREKLKIQKLKIKAGLRDCGNESAKIKYNFSNSSESKLNNLIDSVMLMTLGEHIINNRRPIDHLKLQNLRKIIVDRPISTVQPTRTNSRGMNSQVVIEKQLAMYKERKVEVEKMREVQRQQQPPQQQTKNTKQYNLPQPHAKPIGATKPQNENPVAVIPFADRSSSSGSNSLASKSAFSSPATNSSTSIPIVVQEKPVFGSKQPTPTFGTTNSLLYKASTKPIEFKSPPIISSGSASIQKDCSTEKSSVISTGGIKSSLSFSGLAQIEKDTAASNTSTSPSLNVKTKVPTELNKALKSTLQQSTSIEKPKPVIGFSQASAFSFGSPSSLITPSTSTPSVVSIQRPIGLKSAINTSTGISCAAVASTFTPSNIKSDSLTSPATEKLTNVNLMSTQISSSSMVPTQSPIFITSNADTTSAMATTSSTVSSSFTFSLNTVPITSPTTRPIQEQETVLTKSTADPSSIFKDFSICKPTNSETSSKDKNVFYAKAFDVTSNSSPFGNQSTVISSSTASIATTSSSTSAIFGGISAPVSTEKIVSPIFAAPIVSAPITSSKNIFANTNAALGLGSTSGSNIFGGSSSDQKPIFGNSNQHGSTISSPSNTSNANMFGTTTNVSNSTAIFGGNASSTNVFGSPNVSNSGSIFGQTSPVSSPFGQPAGAFSSQNNNAASGGSLFGATSTFNSSDSDKQTGSIFGGNSFSQSNASALTFGSQSFNGEQKSSTAGFGSPPSGLFSQVAQTPIGSTSTGFGNTAQNTGSGFGQSATFGSAPIFGSPKAGFGTFSASNVNSFGASSQQNNLFESLGSSNTGMTFGNLAQNQDQPASVQKPFGQGSSFSNWR